MFRSIRSGIFIARKTVQAHHGIPVLPGRKFSADDEILKLFSRFFQASHAIFSMPREYSWEIP